VVFSDRETSGIMNLLLTGESQPSYVVNHHVIAQLFRTLINAFVNVDQVRIPANEDVRGDFYIMVTACWVERSTRRVLLIEKRVDPSVR